MLTLPTPVPTRLWRPLPWLVAGALTVLYALLSVTNHLHLGTTGYDLGIFEQAVRAYSELRAPVSDLKGPGYVLLGDHFHPILITLAPFYRLFPGPITLLVAQAVLLGVSAVPVVRIAQERFGSGLAAAVGVAYGLSWGIQTTVDFDFHEVVFAVPLLAFAMENLLRRRWTAAVAWAAPIILVKEDLPLTFAVLGAYLVLKGQRRLGAWVVATGIVSFLLILVVIIPSFNPTGSFDFANELGKDEPWWQILLDGPERLVAPQEKLFTLSALLVPTAFLALFSPLALLAIPTLLWRFMSTNSSYWIIGFHYSAVLMPIMYLAMLDGLGAGRRILPAPAFLRLRKAVIGISAVMVIAGFTGEPLAKLTKASTWQPSPRATAAQQLMDKIPDGVTVAATNDLAPHLTNRCTVQLFPSIKGRVLTPEWIIADRGYTWPVSPDWVTEKLNQLTTSGYQTVDQRGDFILLHRVA